MSTSSDSKEILLVEDDLISRMALKEQLEYEALGHVSEAKSDVEVYDCIADNHFDVILMDVQLKNSNNGIDITKHLRSIGIATPVIFITGNTESATFQEMLSVSPHAIFDKPVILKQLRNSILTAYSQHLPEEKTLGDDKVLSLIYETAKVGMCVTDRKGTFVRVNKAYCDTYGYAESELIGSNFTLVLPDEYRVMAQQIHDDFISKKMVELPSDWKVQRKDGKIVDVFVTAGHMVNDDNKSYKITTVTDVSEKNNQLQSLQKTLKEREALEKEVFHRVKNNLNMIVSLFQMQKSRIESENIEAKQIITSGISRVRSLSLLHEKLYKQDHIASINMVGYIRDLVKFLFDRENPLTEKLALELEDLECDVDTAICVGLIANELLTNAIKHGFEQIEDSSKLTLRLKNEAETCTLSLSDNGLQLSEDFLSQKRNSLGIQLITSLTDQIDGTFHLKIEGRTKTFEITFPKYS